VKKRINACYTGRVQGVGFRFTVREISDSLGITGWVKNLKDGRVEIVAEAEEGLLHQFLTKINEYLSNYITDTEITWHKATQEFNGFTIRF